MTRCFDQCYSIPNTADHANDKSTDVRTMPSGAHVFGGIGKLASRSRGRNLNTIRLGATFSRLIGISHITSIPIILTFAWFMTGGGGAG